MPMIDMPLRELVKYQGQTPAPKDFDKFWSKSLKELDRIKPDLELVPIKHPAPSIEAFDMYFTGIGGARIHAILVRPKNISKPAPAIVEFHGYAGSCGSVTSKLGFTAMGYSVAAMDCRGQGGKSVDVGGILGTTLRGHLIRGIESADKLIFRAVFLDCVQLVRIMMKMDGVDPKRIATTGGSQGGGLSIVAASLVPEVACCAAAFPFLSDYKRVWDMDCSCVYEEIREYFRKYDPFHEKEDEIFNTLGYIDIQNLSKRIKNPVLMSVGLRDTICPASTVYACYNKIKAKKKMLVYPDFGHEGLPGWDDESFNFFSRNL